MPRWVGLLGSWALLVLAVGILGYAVAAEAITVTDARKLERVRTIDRMIEQQVKQQLNALQSSMSQTSSRVTNLQSEVASTEKQIEDLHDSNFVITVSTSENKVYAHRDGQLVFEAIASTGSNSTLRTSGGTKVFRTPIGRFRIQSKEENPKWVPPDWHYIEEAQKYGMRVVHLQRGQSIGGLYVSGNNVYADGYALPEGQVIVRGGAVVIPPVGTRQRQFPDVLGTHRLNLGDGYALHGTQNVRQLGQAVSHGCVRLHNDDISRLYSMASVGDEVIIY
ncbi:MAG TPA: L,D-transpeptidase [Thermoanaerobaculia bacterium]|jgi:lipoprotein-anchoring transpeptidase ErfK/SrfK|nr:L,D-transpeptidase [Thermoanaerobaculia bacterium]